MENNTQPKDPNEFYTDNLTLADLQPGDILTFEGESDDLISSLIMKFTHSKVTHGALYYQNTPIPALADAGASGIFAHKVEYKEGARCAFVSRLTKKGRLKSNVYFEPEEMAPVHDAAKFYLSEGLKYPYSDLVLLALILIYKDISDSGIKQTVIIGLLKVLAAEIKKLIDDKFHQGKHTMVCSSFVNQCYLDASQKNSKLKIQLNKDADLRLMKAHPSNTLFDLYVEHASEYDYHTEKFQMLEAAPVNQTLDELLAEAVNAPQNNRVMLLKSNELSSAIESLLKTLMKLFKIPFTSIKDLIENAKEMQSMFVTPNDLCFNIKNADKVGKIALDRYSENLDI